MSLTTALVLIAQGSEEIELYVICTPDDSSNDRIVPNFSVATFV